MTLAEQLRADASRIENLRTDILFGDFEYGDMPDGKGSAHFLQAISFLDLAHRSLKLSSYEQGESA